MGRDVGACSSPARAGAASSSEKPARAHGWRSLRALGTGRLQGSPAPVRVLPTWCAPGLCVRALPTLQWRWSWRMTCATRASPATASPSAASTSPWRHAPTAPSPVSAPRWRLRVAAPTGRRGAHVLRAGFVWGVCCDCWARPSPCQARQPLGQRFCARALPPLASPLPPPQACSAP